MESRAPHPKFRHSLTYLTRILRARCTHFVCVKRLEGAPSVHAKVEGRHLQRRRRTRVESVNYAGSSCVMRFSGGEVSILDMMGKGEEGLLVIDTNEVSL